MRRYPTDERGLVVPSTEFWTPQLRGREINNHHMWYTARHMSRFVITHTLRDLDAYQEQIPVVRHNWIHQEFEDPRLPRIGVLMDRLSEAYEGGEVLRVGSARHPQYSPISDARWERIQREYTQMKGQVV